jgi:hypothetical protein
MNQGKGIGTSTGMGKVSKWLGSADFALRKVEALIQKGRG